jgi:broad specificity phosphatase PhoE
MLRLPSQDGSTRLVLVRHLDPDESLRGRVFGALDVPLSSSGRRHAGYLAEWLEGLSLKVVYSSPLRRALETAEPLAARHGLRPIVQEGLREIDFGELEGQRFEEIAATRPDVFSALMRQPARTSFPGGESFADLRARALPAAEAIRLRHPGAGGGLVAPGGGPGSSGGAALGLADDALFRLDQSYGGVSVVDWFGDVPLLRLMNATACG